MRAAGPKTPCATVRIWPSQRAPEHFPLRSEQAELGGLAGHEGNRRAAEHILRAGVPYDHAVMEAGWIGARGLRVHDFGGIGNPEGGRPGNAPRPRLKGLVWTAPGPQTPQKRKRQPMASDSKCAMGRSRIAETRQKGGTVYESPIRSQRSGVQRVLYSDLSPRSGIMLGRWTITTSTMRSLRRFRASPMAGYFSGSGESRSS